MSSSVTCSGCSALPARTVSITVDLFLIPGMDRDADLRFTSGPHDYNVSWLLLTFLGLFGVHRMYLGKWLTGLLYLLTGGLFLIGYIYNYWTLNDQLDEFNRA